MDETWLIPFEKKKVCKIYFIYGPQNVGKTTFANFALNTLLSEEQEVFLLDADVG